MSRFLFCALIVASRLAAQTPPAGVTTEQDIRKTLAAMAEQSTKLDPILNQMRPKDWVSDGAPQTYVEQWQSAKTQNQAVAQASRNLMQKPDQITPLLQLFFRIQSFDAELRSLEEGLRKHQNPSLADLMVSVSAEGMSARNQLQQYVMELVTEREQQFAVADREAQRCRESISKAPRTTR
jgi:SOS response regulatory protein OraA/RecX